MWEHQISNEWGEWRGHASRSSSCLPSKLTMSSAYRYVLKFLASIASSSSLKYALFCLSIFLLSLNHQWNFKSGILFPTITPNILARYMMTCILTILCRQHTASHQYHQSCYHSNDSQSSKNTNKGGLGASLPPSHKTEAELTCPLNTWHEGWKKQTRFSLPHICGILIKMHNIAEMLVGYCVEKFSSATPY